MYGVDDKKCFIIKMQTSLNEHKQATGERKMQLHT